MKRVSKTKSLKLEIKEMRKLIDKAKTFVRGNIHEVSTCKS